MKIKREIRKMLAAIKEVWQHHDSVNTWEEVVWLIEKQLQEIKESGFEETCCRKESADIMIILLRFLDKRHIDPEQLCLQRLETRHKGRTKEICLKYQKIKEEENVGKDNQT